MKSLYIIRHAKSSWGDFSLPDFERPLNERGKKDAPMMAQRLLHKNAGIDIFMSSPAKRAIKTAKFFCNEYNRKEESIIVIDKLYHASVETFYNVVNNIDDENETAAIFSHNPGITDFVNSLGLDVKIDNMPTCGIFAVALLTKTWKHFTKGEKKFLLFEYPKLV